ncbi:hypothetical protein [Snuella lapsa]|uniref:Uncharacterized protein n=1 Tax=Snuella lapsa TaxID=870481 RepID=A0ABP6WYA1_9FLAO
MLYNRNTLLEQNSEEVLESSDSESVKIKADIKDKYLQFNKLFNSYQRNLRTNQSYIKYEAFRDMKFIFELYSQIYQFRGYDYYDIPLSKFQALTSEFDCRREKELYEYLVRSLIREGNETKSKEFTVYVNKLEIKCLWLEIITFKCFFVNLIKLFLKVSSYNILALILTGITYISILSLIFSAAPFSWMSVLDVEYIKITTNTWLNQFFNVLSFVFDLDAKPTIKAKNILGVLLLTIEKSIFFVVIINFILKEIMNKIKLYK